MMRIENIVLNLAFIVYRKSAMNISIDNNTLNIGDAVVRFMQPYNSGAQHFADFALSLNDGGENEFFLIADVWATHLQSLYAEMIHDVLYEETIRPKSLYENTDLVITENETLARTVYLVKNASLDEKLPVKYIASCFVMKYTWRGDIDSFMKEILVEQMKSSFEFKNYFENAVIIEKGEKNESYR